MPPPKRLAEDQDVGHDPVVLAGEHPPGLAEPGRDLVEDQAARRAGRRPRAPRLPEAGRRQVGDRAGGLGDDRGDVALALEHVVDHAAQAILQRIEVRLAVASTSCP
jgi:hypothetical protein